MVGSSFVFTLWGLCRMSRISKFSRISRKHFPEKTPFPKDPFFRTRPLCPKRFPLTRHTFSETIKLRATISRHLLPPISRWGRKQWIYIRDPVETVGLPTERVVFPVQEKGQLHLGKRGAKATRNGDHDFVHV